MSYNVVTTYEVRDETLQRLDVQASLAAASRSLPNGSYTTLRSYGGRRVLRLDRHVRRLVESASELGAPATLDESRVRRALTAALRDAGHPESRVRLTFAPPRLFVSVEPFEPLPDALYREGVACVTLPLRRDHPHSKDTRFIPEAAAAYASLPEGIHEGLLRAEDGGILEGLSSNFFAVRESALHSEDERALPGVTRSLVLELARGLVPVSAAPVRTDQLDSVSECFLTSVSRGVLPVVRIDGRSIGDGRPGPITRALIERLADVAAREAESVD